MASGRDGSFLDALALRIDRYRGVLAAPFFGKAVALPFDQAPDDNNPPSTQQFFASSSTRGQIRINGLRYSVSSVDIVGSTVTVEVGNGCIFQNGDSVSLRYHDGDTVDSSTAIQNQAGVDVPDFRTSFTAHPNAPTVAATGNAPTFTQNATPVDLFSGVTASTNTGQLFTGVTLRVTNVTDDGGSTTPDVGGGNRITILGRTGNVAAWFG